jgi:hypothetical protein
MNCGNYATLVFLLVAEPLRTPVASDLKTNAQPSMLANRMGRKLIVFLLLLLPAGQSAAHVWTGPGAHTQTCQCDERMCHCPHRHQPAKSEKPKCHFPNGTNGPTLQACDAQDQQAVASGPYLPAPPPSVAYRPSRAVLPVPSYSHHESFCPEINPPPPRRPLA